LLAQNVNPKIVQEMLGHANISMLFNESARQVANVIDDFLRQLD
jgi:hypothetical protein